MSLELMRSVLSLLWVARGHIRSPASPLAALRIAPLKVGLLLLPVAGRELGGDFCGLQRWPHPSPRTCECVPHRQSDLEDGSELRVLQQEMILGHPGGPRSSQGLMSGTGAGSQKRRPGKMETRRWAAALEHAHVECGRDLQKPKGTGSGFCPGAPGRA